LIKVRKWIAAGLDRRAMVNRDSRLDFAVLHARLAQRVRLQLLLS
jgi:hypothetical protein